MVFRSSATSTPNLYNGVDLGYHYKESEKACSVRNSTVSLSRAYSLKRINFKSESELSIASKRSNVQMMTSFVNLGSCIGSSSKGVHFCPVVSEVSWQDNYSSRSTSSDSELEPERETRSMAQQYGQQSVYEEHEMSPSIDEMVQRLLTDSTTPKPKRSENEVRNQRVRLDFINSPPRPRGRGGSNTMNVFSNVSKAPSSPCATFLNRNLEVVSYPDRKKHSSKVIGFFQRFSLKSLSHRRSKNKKLKKAPPAVVGYTLKREIPDSRIIPLYDRGQDENNPPVSSKPPLTPSPPTCQLLSDDIRFWTSYSFPAVEQQHYSRDGDPSTPTVLCEMALQVLSGIDPNTGMSLFETDTDLNVDRKFRSLSTEQLAQIDRPITTSFDHSRYDRAKSMEFLLDKENQYALKVPENELQKGNGERKMSEQELRVQRSLQKLNVPEWYKNSTVPSQGFLLKRHSDTGQNQQTHHRWNASTLPSKTTSLSSLGFTLPSTSRSSTCTVTSPGPSQYSFSRWSTSRLNSGTNSSSTSPCSSARSSFNYRKPYLGWRSQEKLSKLRTPAERLAAGLLPQNAQNDGSQQFSPSLNEVRSSIKEVTSAIVHYVSGTKDSSDRLSPSTRCTTNSSSRSTSPRGSTGRLCWLESSFVGSKPLNAPETPTAASESKVDLQPKSSKNMSNEECYLNNSQNCCDNSSYNNRVNNVAADPNEDYSNQCRYDAKRRRSDGTDLFVQMLKGPKSNVDRRISCDVRSNAIKPAVSSVPPSTVKLVVQCRYHKCGKTAAPDEAKRTFKVCHNCDYVYCSRICRRDHWEQHRKVCLHSRVGELCRRVLAAIKQNEQLLLVASTVARKGFLAHGRGCVKFYFHTPQLAEHFATGSVYQPEAGFVKWTELMSSDVGNDLYSELLKVCKSYNPDTRFVVLVCIHVVSEVPSNGPVKWERQIISRYVKTKISPDLMIRNPSLCNVNEESQPPETLILTSLPESHDPSKKNRRVNFTNIQKQLRQRGISLRKQFPDVHKKLSDYVEGNEPFTPITIYPIDAASGKTFMCVIMPEDEAEKLDSILENNRNVKTIDVASAKTSSSSE